MGKWCMDLLPCPTGSFSDAREETYETFRASTTLTPDADVRTAFDELFNRTIGASLQSGVAGWDETEKGSALHQFRRIAHAAEQMATAEGQPRITASIFTRAANARLATVHDRESFLSSAVGETWLMTSSRSRLNTV